MADVLTSRLRMTKPDVGGSDDTWGSKLNTDWDIIDRVYQDLTGALVSTTFGSPNAHEVTLSHSAYSDIDSTLGFRLLIRSGAANTGIMTLDVGDGNGPRSVRKVLDGNPLKQLDVGDFPLDYPGDFVYIRRSGFSGWILLNPATGVVSPPPDATETVIGVSRMATNQEAQAGLLGTVAVTPKNLKTLGASLVPYAQTTVAGIVELATNEEAWIGTDGSRAITPVNLDWVFDQRLATTSVRAGVLLADGAEAIAGTNQTKAITPVTLKYAIDARVATTGVSGVVELALGSETLAGTDNTRAVTPFGLDYAFANRVASQTERGPVLLALDSDALTGNDPTKALTARNLDYVLDNRVASQTVKGAVVFATDQEAYTGTNTTKAINPESLDYVLDLRITALREEFDARIVAVLKQYGLIPE